MDHCTGSGTMQYLWKNFEQTPEYMSEREDPKLTKVQPKVTMHTKEGIGIVVPKCMQPLPTTTPPPHLAWDNMSNLIPQYFLLMNHIRPLQTTSNLRGSRF